MNRATLDFSLPAADGARLSLSDIRAGQAAAVVVFTCNHCPYALAWHDRLQRVAREYAGHGVGFVQINANDAGKYPADSFAAMEERVRRGEFASPYLRDESQDVARNWGAKVTPHVFVIDASGDVAYQGAPDADYSDESQDARWLRQALDDVLAGRPVAEAKTQPQGCSVKWKK